MTEADVSRIWPLFGLTIRTPRLALKPPTDEEYVAICKLAVDGIHPPEEMPFTLEWTDAPSTQLQRSAFQFLWQTRAAFSAEDWHLEFAVYHNGEPIGMKAIWATDFSRSREFSTGSWLGRRFQGLGFGKEMRAAVLHLCFTHLGAEHALSQVFADNPASLAVNRHHGYVDDGYDTRIRRGEPAVHRRFRLASQDWLARFDQSAYRVKGLDDCREMLIVDGGGTPV